MSEPNYKFFAQFLDDYFAECAEHLALLRRNLLTMEKYLGQPRIEQSLLDELFRSFHTLKGISGMVGISEAEQLAHNMESYLRALRQGEKILTEAGFETLMSGTVLLEQVIAARQKEERIPDPIQVLKQLESLMAGPTPAEPMQTTGRDLLPGDRGQPFFETTIPLWRFVFEPTTRLSERGVNVGSIRARLQAIGELRQAMPMVIEGGGIAFEFILASAADESVFADWTVDNLNYSRIETVPETQRVETTKLVENDFLATISHELRTPLNAIIGWASMLISGKLDEKSTVRAVETIYRNAQAQNKLIGDLLDISRIVSGKLKLDARPIELPPIIEAAVNSMRPAADAKGVLMATQMDPLAGPISGDADRMQQVIWNLLNNAVKFTPKHGRVQVKLARADSHVEITVSDTGVGISPEFLPHVFDRFRQAEAASTRVYGGLGLGLSIVRQLVELHGGSVRVSSEGEGKGASFNVSLPVLVPREERAEPSRINTATDHDVFRCDSESLLSDVRVVVVDDELETLDLLQAVLERCGATVITGRSAAEGLVAVKQELPDVLISDLGMPGEDGYSFISRVRALAPEQGGRTPAAALTAFARVEDRLRVLRSGFQIHLPKPIEPAELVAVVANLARRAVRSKSESIGSGT